MPTLRRIVLARHVEGAPRSEDFRLEETALPELKDGQALIRILFASVDPGTRSRMSAGASYAQPMKLGETIDGFNIGEVIESRNEKFAPGDRVTCAAGWADHLITDGKGFVAKLPNTSLPLSAFIGVLGVPGLTAYFGLKRVAQVKEGERVLVTSAAGPVGATAGQLAKAWGCRAVGIAGGATKCAWLVDGAGFDASVDYKDEAGFDAALDAALPEGADVLFDNVGNAMIDRLIPRLRKGGRIVISGQVADYNATGALAGVTNTRYFIANRLRMEGIVVFDDIRGFAGAQGEMADLISAGKLSFREIFYDGLDAAPRAFMDVFSSPDFGRRIVRVAS